MTVTITVFPDQYARSKSVQEHTLEELAALIRNTQRSTKQELPWLKLASFGNRTDNGSSCLRWDGNVLDVTGCEADYDREQMDFDEAVERLESAGIEAIVYTSPSHEPFKPRWRALAPFSEPLPPDRRAAMVARLNGVLGGVVADESFALSQSYYFGHPYEPAEVRAEVVRGTRIDLLPGLDAGAIGKSNRQSGNGEERSHGFGGGLDVIEMIRRIETGESLHPPMMSLAGKLARETRSRPLITEMLHGIFLTANQGRYAGRWPEVLRELDHALDKEIAKQAPAQPAFAWNSIDLDGQPTPEPKYIVPNRIPAQQITLFTGHGGSGKSTIGLQLACAHVLGRDWLGSMPEPGPAWFIDTEDPFAIVHWRIDKILSLYNASFTDLINGGLHIAALSGKETILATRDGKTGIIRPTELYLQLIEQAKILKPVNIVIASLAGVFAGNENDRGEVQQFINLLKAFTNITGRGLTLIAHPSKTALADGNGYSGSTMWFNGARAQLNLSGADEGGLRKLEFLKNQYGAEEQPLTLRWQKGIFTTEATGEAAYEKAAREQQAEQTFLSLLQTNMKQGRNLSHKPNAPNFAPKAMVPQANGLAKKDLIDAMERLFQKDKIKVAIYGRQDKGWERIEPA